MQPKTNEEIKSKTDMLKEMQNISEDIEKYKIEVENILLIIDKLELKYYELANKIQTG